MWIPKEPPEECGSVRHYRANSLTSSKNDLDRVGLGNPGTPEELCRSVVHRLNSLTLHHCSDRSGVIKRLKDCSEKGYCRDFGMIASMQAESLSHRHSSGRAAVWTRLIPADNSLLSPGINRTSPGPIGLGQPIPRMRRLRAASLPAPAKSSNDFVGTSIRCFSIKGAPSVAPCTLSL